jgi:SpoVK/Ycf46/Vps4 family AAA+-type ATPase
LPGGTTIVLVDSALTPFGLISLYDSLPSLAPAAVFFDDIDLLAGDRRRGTSCVLLQELLTRLDGFAPPAPVVTVTTTNDAGAIDPALIRPGRFDAIIEVRPPDRPTRERILRRYLAPLAEFDVAPIAAVTEGATGADLREIVRRAVLERGSDITAAHLLELVRTGRWKPNAPTGQYL